MQKGFSSVLALIVVFLIVTIGTFTFFGLRPKPIPQNVPNVLTSDIALKDAGIYEEYIIYWGEDNRLYSINTHTENVIDLSRVSEDISDAIEIAYDYRVTRLCYVKDEDIWCINSDGSDLKKTVSKPSKKQEGYEVKLLVLTDDQKLIFVYDYQVGIGNIEPNPEVKYGTYVFDLKSNQTRFLHEISESSDFEFLDLADNTPIYFNTFDRKLFQLDLNNGQFKKFSDVVLPAHPDYYLPKGTKGTIRINTNTKELISTFRDSRHSGTDFSKELKTEDYSQVLIFNYGNGKIAKVSPPGNYAEYGISLISPDFVNIVYEHAIFEGNKKSSNWDTYVYNTNSQKSESLDTNIVYASSPAIILKSNTVFLFGDKGAIYNYDLSTNKLKKIWEP